MDRNKKIIKISILGIVVNLLLVIFKSIIGLITNSIAIILDAVNNLSDVLSATITIVGTKLSSKKPDKEHPYGHGRIEYFASAVISIIILAAGITALKESFLKIINPVKAEYSIISLVVIIVAVFTKIFLGKYVKKQGKILNSSSLIATGVDAISDAVVSFSTFVTAIISMIWKISLEGYLGVIISIIILKAAYDILKTTINAMIGVRADSELTLKLREKIHSYEGVLGVYDLILHNYGPSSIIATAHIQVDDNTTAKEIHRLTKKISTDVYKEYGIILTLGIYASNNEEKYNEIKEYINTLVKQYKNILQTHGFYVDEEQNNISIDVIISFDEKNPEETIEEIKTKLKDKFPKYDYTIVLDRDFSD